MIYLDMSVEDFLLRYPSLENRARLSCLEHGYILNDAQPYMSHKMVGLILNPKYKEGEMKIFKNREDIFGKPCKGCHNDWVYCICEPE